MAESDLRSVIRGLVQLWRLHQMQEGESLTAEQVAECMDQSYYRLSDAEMRCVGAVSEELFQRGMGKQP